MKIQKSLKTQKTYLKFCIAAKMSNAGAGAGEWKTPKVSHVRPTVVRPINLASAASVTASPSPGMPAQQSTPFPPLEEGPLTPSFINNGHKSMEGRVRRIEESVQSIAAILMDKKDVEVLRADNRRLQELNQDLSGALKESEERLSKLQEGVAEIQEEYREESEELIRKVEELGEAVEEERMLREGLEKERDRAERGRRGLEQYLDTLPSRDEFDAIKRRLRQKEEEAERLRERLAESEAGREKAVKEGEKVRTQLEESESSKKELKDKLELMERESEEAARRRLEADQLVADSGSSKVEVELILEERDRCRRESRLLSKSLKVLEARCKRDVTALSDRLKRDCQQLKEASKELQLVQDHLKQERSTSSFLRSDLTQARGEAAALRAKVDALRREAAEVKSAGDDSMAADRAAKVLAKELRRCANDIGSLAQAARTIVCAGKDPPVNLLLGVSESESETVFEEDCEDRASKFRALLEEVRATREDVRAVREELADRYAENLGNDLNSCVTQ